MACEGERLAPVGRNIKISGLSISSVCDFSAQKCAQFVQQLTLSTRKLVLAKPTDQGIADSVLASLSGLDVAVEEAARVLGASGPEAFRLVTLPLILPGLVAGALVTFITSLDNVPVTIFLISASQTTLPVLIFSSVEMGIDPSVAAVSTLLITATGLILLFAERRFGLHRFV